MGDMKTPTRILVLVLACALAVPGAAAARPAAGPLSVTLRPVQDVSFPFWCSWGYDWEERCWWEDGDRLPIGGDEDKVWRAGLRFSLTAIPPGSEILFAELRARHDAVCLGPRKTTRPCSSRAYSIDLHPILTASWFSEREVEFGPAISRAVLSSATEPGWLDWDVTDLVAAWVAGEANDGVLLKLGDEQEDYGVGGPALASSTFVNPAARPALHVDYVPPDE